MFALCILMALIVMPLSLLPGGMSLLGMWVRLMVWVQTWPLFFAVLNFMGHLWLAQSAQTVMISNGMGLNMLTQNGLAEAAWDKYCIVQYLYLLVPLIAWGVVSRSGHAIVSLAERLAPTIGRSLGGAAVDNTLSFDTQQFHNRSRGMFSFAQQQLSPSFQSGTVMDDGQMVARHKAIGVKQGDVSPTVQEHMTSLRTNVASNYESSGSLLQASEEARQTGLQAQKQSQETRGYHESTAKSLSEALSQGRAAVQGWSQQENTQKAQKISYSITAAQNVSDAETARDERGQSFGVGVNSSTPKLIGTSFHANAERRSNASDISTTEQTAKVDTSSGFSKEQSEVYQAIKENRMNYSDDETRRLAQDFRHSYDQTKQYQESTQAHFSRSARLQEAAHISEKLGSTINTNLNDSALQYTANKRFSGDKTAAAHWQHDHTQEYQQDAQEYLKQYDSRMKEWIQQSNTPINENQFLQTAKEMQRHVQNSVAEQSFTEKEAHAKLAQTSVDVFQKDPDMAKRAQEIQQNKKDFSSTEKDLLKQREKFEEKHRAKADKNLITRSGKKWSPFGK